jgi:type IV pilus assembly protein PilO
MNFIDELRNLDFNDIGRWPMAVQAFFVALFFIVASVAGFWFFVWQEKAPILARAETEERELRSSFEEKQRKAANFTAYKTQLAEIEQSFGTMLRQLPGKTEIPNLLVDISQTGLAAGLQEELFQPLDEDRRDFYAEKPIKIRLSCSYHEFAALPRIVTLHDLEITPKGKDPAFDELVLNVTAKTYRYLDEEEVAAAQADEDAKAPKGKRAPARKPADKADKDKAKAKA